MAGAIYTDIISRFDGASANSVANQLIGMFRKTGEDASKAMNSGLSQMGSSFSTAGMRAELASAEADLKRLRDAEAEAARVMVKANNDIEVSTRRAAEVTAKFGDTSSQAARAQGALADAEFRAASATSKHLDAMLATEGAAQRVTQAHNDTSSAVGLTAASFNKLGAGALVLAGGTMLETGNMAGHLQQQILKVGASAGETGDIVGGRFTGNLQTVQKGVLDLMGATGYSSDQLTSGLYTIEKAGYHGTDALKVLTAAAQGASSEQADLAQVVDGLTTSMADFHVTPEGAAKLMSQMVVATGEAKSNFQDFAGALHSVEPAAAAAHLKLEDVWGVLAQMTQSGMSTDQSAVDMNQAITSLSVPNDAQAKKMQQLHIDPDEVSQNLRTRGLAGTMQALYAKLAAQEDPTTNLVDTGKLANNAGALANLHAMLEQTGDGAMSDRAKASAQAYFDNTKGNRAAQMDIRGMTADDASKLKTFKELTDQVNNFSARFAKGRDTLETVNGAMKDITGTTEALRVMLQTTGENADSTNERIKKIAEADLDPDGKVKGFTKSQEGFDAKMRDVKGGFEALGISLGETFLPALDKAANGLHDIVGFIDSHEPVVKDAAIAVGALGAAWATVKTGLMIKDALSAAYDGFTNLLGVADRVMGGVSQKVISAEDEFGRLGTSATTASTQVETAATAEGTAQEGVATKATAANTAMGTGRATAAEAGVAAVNLSSDEEVAAEERVQAAAQRANTTMQTGAGAAGIPAGAGTNPMAVPGALPFLMAGTQPDQMDAGSLGLPQTVTGPDGKLRLQPPTPHATGGVFGPMPAGATIAPPSGRGLVQWAEDSTGGESYIPLNGGQRSIDIWAQTGRLLGVFDEGGFRGDTGPGYGAEGWRSTVAEVVDEYGPAVGITPATRDAWIDAIVRQIQIESHGDPNADNPNDSNGRGGTQHVAGLLQYLPSSYAMSGGALTGLPFMDPVGQIAGALFAPRNPDGTPAHLGRGGGWGPVATPIDSAAIPMGGGTGGYYTQDTEKVWRAQEHIQKLEDRITVLQERISEETGKTKQSEKDRLDRELDDAKRELEHAKGELAQAERGTYHAGRSGRRGSRGGGSGDELGGNLPEAFGLKEGLPGLVKYGITALADLAFAPAIGALEAVSQAAGGKEATGSGLMGFLGQQMGLGGGGGLGGGFGAGLGAPSAASKNMYQRFYGYGTEHHASGGPVGTDTVPAWLTPGEIVVNKDAAQSHYDELMAMNAGHYDKGGLIGDPNLPVITDYFQRNYWSAKNDKGEHWPLSEPPIGDQQVWDSDTGLPTQWGPGKGFSSWGDKGQDRGSIRHGDNSDRYPISGADKNGNGAWNYGMWLGPGTDATWQGYFATGGEVPDEPTQIGGVAQAAGTGSGFGGLGGLPMAGLQTAASGLDLLAPGAGQAAQVGIQELNRAAAYAGQVGGILTGGFMDALIPHESELAGKSWFTKLAGGLAGAKPELPNTAGDKPPAPQQKGGDTHVHNGDKVGVQIQGDYNGKQGEDAAGADLARHQAATAASGTPRGGFFTG